MVADTVSVDLNLWIKCFDPVRVSADKRIRQGTGGKGHLQRPLISGKSSDSLLYFVLQQAQHTHTVLKLQVAVIIFFRGQLTPGSQIPFITCVDKM